MGRKLLNERIHMRSDEMMKGGWLKEAESVHPNKNQNALNTVGYKELFAYLEGHMTWEEAITKIKTNTRRFAKRQMTWFRRMQRKGFEIFWIDGQKSIDQNVELAKNYLIRE